MIKMNKAILAVTVLALTASFAVAGPKKTAAPKCPKCKMELSTKKDKGHSMAVKIGKKTFYCCAACGAHTAPKKK